MFRYGRRGFEVIILWFRVTIEAAGVCVLTGQTLAAAVAMGPSGRAGDWFGGGYRVMVTFLKCRKMLWLFR